MFIAAQTNWIQQMRLILIGVPGSSFPSMTCVALVQALGGSPNLTANIIMRAYGLNASSSLIRVFQTPWCRPLGLDAVLSLMNEKPSLSFLIVRSLPVSIGLLGSG